MAPVDLAAAFARASLAQLPAAGTTVVVAVSGGADSVALLRLLVSAARHRIIVFHLDHALRGDSAADSQWVEALAHSLGCVAMVQRCDIASVAAMRKWGLEQAGREERYARLTQVAIQHQAQAVLTAHHRDDHLETILLQLLRGTGAGGPHGLQARRMLQDVPLIRPLLAFTHLDLVHYLESLGQAWRQDASNAEVRLRRNFCRHRLLPVLRAAEPQFDQALEAWSNEFAPSAQGTSARELLSQRGITLSRPRIRRLEELQRGDSGRALHLGPWLVRYGQGQLHWQDLRSPPARPPEAAIHGPSTQRRGDEALLVRLEAHPGMEQLRVDGEQAFINPTRVGWPWRWRAATSDDSWQQLGAVGRQSVFKTLAARKIPRARRAHTGVICDQEGVIWIPGIGVSERVRIDAQCPRVLHAWRCGGFAPCHGVSGS